MAPDTDNDSGDSSLGSTCGQTIPVVPTPKLSSFHSSFQRDNESRKRYAPAKPIAVLVDGAFFLKAYRNTIGRGTMDEPRIVAKKLHEMAFEHSRDSYLYRRFYYDCPPLAKKAHHPLTGKAVDFSKSVQADFRRQLHAELKKLRKVALRLGYLADQSGGWQIRPHPLKELLNGKRSVADLAEDDVFYDVRQKSVDMKIGLDIASLAYKAQVGRIVLVAGVGDFVPAAKLARREGIDFILDNMWQHISEDLFEHIDGLQSYCPKPVKRNKS
jgi:uncharacterized LabA/DUF88 family protein